MEKKFTWIPFYTELAKKLLEFKDNRSDLVKIVYELDEKYVNFINNHDKSQVFDIDFFSFFSIFNRGLTEENRKIICGFLKNKLNISAEIPSDFDSIPLVDNRKSTFYRRETADSQIPLLCSLFEAVFNDDLPLVEKLFDKVLGFNGIKWNITMGFYWVSPYNFMPLDSNSRNYLKNNGINVFDEKELNGKNYLNLLEEIKNCIQTGKLKEKSIPEISDNAWKNPNDSSDGANTMSNNSLADQLTDLLQHTRNLILHGAPGTGKTFLAKQIAEKMGCSQNEIGFVQFHPSYDYTDFVEGLRPKSQNNGEIGFERKDGVFKEFCKRALLAMNVSSVSDNFEQVWENVVDYLNEKDFMDVPLLTGKSTFRVELNENGDGLATRTYENGDYKKGEWIQGKSKFYNKEQLYNIYKGLPGIPSRGHDNYRKAVIEYWKKNFGLVDYSIKEKSETESVKPFLFIIDEINRGELSKIFGELFYAVEPGYRVSYDDLKKHQSGEKMISTIRTQYANLETEGNEFDKALRVSNPSDYGHFFIPENVYIIGTMNDIDRSVDTMDFAFRRRFAFKEIKASENLEMLAELGEIADEAENRLKKLNNEISKLTELSSPSSYHIGGAYFMKLKDFKGTNNERFQKLWDYHLEGLLKEYLRGTENAEENFEKLKDAYFGLGSTIINNSEEEGE